MQWITAQRPGYFGSRRGDKYAEYDREYGEGNWKIAWDVNGLDYDAESIVLLYEDSYSLFLSAHPQIADQLVSEASEVFDDAESNIESGLQYSFQETNRTHLQDIAIRRSLCRRGQWFQGSKPIQIRDSLGEHPLSMVLSPGRVPFHRPEWIVGPELEGWWRPGSVESFYQSNKILKVRK
jgi:hypothetical protein